MGFEVRRESAFFPPNPTMTAAQHRLTVRRRGATSTEKIQHSRLMSRTALGTPYLWDTHRSKVFQAPLEFASYYCSELTASNSQSACSNAFNIKRKPASVAGDSGSCFLCRFHSFLCQYETVTHAIQ
jgi:hypothetical protein